METIEVIYRNLGDTKTGGLVDINHKYILYTDNDGNQSATLMVDGAEVKLTPGMNLSVEVKTGKRRIIEYLLSPLQQHATESLRER